MHNEQVYTPIKVVNFILDEVGFNKKENIDKKHIIDNSCGNGNFLVEITKRILNNIDNVNKEYLETYIHGIEIEENAYKETISRLNQLVFNYGITDVQWDIKMGNTLTIDDFDDKMDYVVGNPPYCNVHHLSEDNYRVLKENYSLCADGMTDLYIGFFEKGIKMLNKSGILGYITPNSWLTSKAGEKLRQFLYKQNIISKIYNFDTDKLFDNATTFTCITVLDKNKNINDNIKTYHGNFDEINRCHFINREDLYINNKIFTRIESNVIKNILEYKVKDKGKQFAVKNGLATLKDKLFVIEKTDKDASIDTYVELYNDTIIDCVKASKGEYKYIICPYDSNGNPLKYEGLCLYTRNLLKQKAERLDIDTSETNWYLYGRTQAIKDINKYRISCNNIIRDSNDIVLRQLPPKTAVYSGYYIIRNGMIQSEAGMKQLFHQVEDALKTNLFIDYIKSIGKSKNGGYYTFSTKDIEKFLNYFYEI